MSILALLELILLHTHVSYVQNYSDYSPHSYPPAGTGSAGYRRHFTETSSADFGGKNINDVESRYNEMYEQKLNPFAEVISLTRYINLLHLYYYNSAASNLICV